MSAPTKREGAGGGFSQLAVFIPTEVKNEVAAIATLDDAKQVDVVEKALREYCARRRAAHAGARKASV